MEKHAELEIKESLSTLKDLRGKQTSLGKQRRVYALICLKESKFTTRQELANHLGVNIRSLEKWVFQSKTSGLEDLLTRRVNKVNSC
ncbi:MAG: hypothetical protein OCD76_07050 [Reichenbachiella sp.]